MTDETAPDTPEIPPDAELPSAVDPVAIRRRESRKKRDQREGEEFWQNILKSEVGRRELWELFSESHAFEERFACGPAGFPQVEATWFHAGEQSFGLRIYQRMLAIDPVAVRTMHIEHDPRFERYKRNG